MQVILLERVDKLGAIGDEVKVKPGFARNFLLPQGKALRATDANRKRFEVEREAIVKLNAERAAAARSDADKVEGATLVMVRQAGETGQLYGSVSGRDIADAVSEAAGVTIERAMVRMDKPLKAVGLHEVEIRLHAEVAVTVTVNIARSAEEAERQAKGEDVIAAAQDAERRLADEQASQFGGAMDDEDAFFEDEGRPAETASEAEGEGEGETAERG